MAIETANVFDIQKAINPDGTPVDIHRVLASRMFEIPYEAVQENQRRAARVSLYRYLYSQRSGVIHVRR